MRKLLLPFAGAALLLALALTMTHGIASSAPACAQSAAVKVAAGEHGGLKCAHRRVCRPGHGCAWRKVCKRW